RPRNCSRTRRRKPAASNQPPASGYQLKDRRFAPVLFCLLWLSADGWEPEAASRKAGSRKLEAESSKPKAGSRKLEAGSWQPEAGSRKLAAVSDSRAARPPR